MADDGAKSERSSYPRRARYLPGMLMVSPVWVVIVTAGWEDARIVTTLLGAAGAIGVPFLLESFVRQQGHKYDVYRLAGSQGRWTTTNMLWPEPETSPESARNAANRHVVEQVVGSTLPATPPTTDVETATVTAALDEAVAELRAITRDEEKFPLLLQENAEYGMWRNLLGARTYGIVLAALGAVAAAVLVGLSAADAVTSSTAELVAGLLLILVIGVLWWTIPNEQRVVQAAQRYALALLDAARLLGRDVKPA